MSPEKLKEITQMLKGAPKSYSQSTQPQPKQHSNKDSNSSSQGTGVEMSSATATTVTAVLGSYGSFAIPLQAPTDILTKRGRDGKLASLSEREISKQHHDYMQTLRALVRAIEPSTLTEAFRFHRQQALAKSNPSPKSQLVMLEQLVAAYNDSRSPQGVAEWWQKALEQTL